MNAFWMDVWSGPFPQGITKGANRTRQGLYLYYKDKQGGVHTGEASPLPGFSAETFEDARLALSSIVINGLPWAETSLRSFLSIDTKLDTLALPPSARHGLEQVLLSIFAKNQDRDLVSLLGGHPDVPIVNHGLVDSPDSAKAALVNGASALKIKVGRDSPEAFLFRIQTIRQAIGPLPLLRVDANQAYTLAQAQWLLKRLDSVGVELIEEPLLRGDVNALAQLKQGTAIAIAVDENCRNLDQLEHILLKNAADVLVLKPMLIGGLRPSLKMATLAHEAGMALMVTSTLDSPVALQTAKALAHALPTPNKWIHGLNPSTSICHPISNTAGTPQGHDLPNPVVGAANARPNHTALTWGDGSHPDLTWGQIAEKAGKVAASLKEMGLRSGERVALWGDATPDWIVAFYGIGLAGCCAAPLSNQLKDAELAVALAKMAPAVLLHAPQETPPKGPWITLPMGQSDPQKTVVDCFWPLAEKRLAIMSSGTTHGQKVVELSTAQLVFSAYFSSTRLGHLPSDRWLCPLPLHHVGGASILFRCSLLGTTIELWPQFSAEGISHRLQAGGVSLISLVPAMLKRILAIEPTLKPSKDLRVMLVGGDKMPVDLIQQCRDLNLPLSTTWGMSEAASQVATAFPGQSPLTGGGPPLNLCRVTAVEGCLSIRGPIVEGGSLHTSDMGYIQENNVVVTGRRDAIFVSGGENIDPAEIERALQEHPAIVEACVVGIADEKWGTRPVAALVGNGTCPPSDAHLRQHLQKYLSKFKFPDRFLWMNALPKTTLGKINRATLKIHLTKGCSNAD